jgi:heat shock protein HslJ
MYCPEATMTQETNYLGILQNAATWVVDDASGKLTITDNTPQKNTLVYSKTA